MELLDAARTARGGGAVLLGEAGIGKSSLADAIAAQAIARGFIAAWGRCPDLSLAPYWPWRQLLAVLPDSGAREVLDGSGSSSRAELFSGVLAVLERTAADRPLLLILDDVHRADEATLELLAFVAGQVRGTRIVLLVISRDDPVELAGPAASALAGLPAWMPRLDIAGLGQSATAELVRELTPTASDELVANIHRRTGGNPFFVSEVARLHAGRRQQGVESGHDVPTAVQQVLSRRFARIGQEAVRLLEVAAVVGKLDLPVVAAVACLDEEAALTLLDEPLRARLLVGSGPDLRFAHDLVREALYAGLSEQARARLHRAVAAAMPDGEAGALAEHWARALGPEARLRAAEHALAAGESASAAMAYEQAARYFRWALADGAGDPITVRLELGRSQVLAGEVDTGRDTLRQVAAAANQAGRPADAVRAVLAMGSGLGGFEVDIGDPAQERLLAQALGALSDDDLATRAAGLARLSLVRALSASPEERAEQARQAVALAAGVGERAIEAAALAALNDALSGPDHVRVRLAGADRIVAIADEVADPALALLGLRLRLVARLESGDIAGVDHDIAEYDLRAKRLRLPLYAWPVPLWRGMRAAMDGDGELAIRCADEVDRLGREAGSTNAAMMAWVLRLQQAKAGGSPVEFAALMEQVARWNLEPSQWDCCLASIYACSGMPARARFHLDRMLAAGLDSIPKDSEWVELLWQLAEAALVLAEAALVLADRPVAEALRERLAPYAGVWAVDGVGGACFGPVSDMLARLDGFLAGTDPAARRQSESAEPTEPSEVAELRRDGRVWHVAFRGRRATVQHSKGMADLATLVTRPGHEVHVLDLVEAGGGPARREVGADSGPVLDRQARTAYQARLRELEEDIGAAASDADLGRVSTLTAERDFLLAELAGALGLSGRDRVMGDPAERARKAVTMRIATAQRAIAESHPELARHLHLAVSTGRFCCYRPERPVAWRTRADDATPDVAPQV
ncbi:AAA ATPase domain-containing protein [Actinokineospora alba]|uniref:AAA ATPase domain-containing protein n=2 Tax=Actinokineospora alba TaxID=504798 RepID=A0A1H0LUA1_9PSEU|nr:AAA ATPase domain-containing protein [Actinokineospora alba]SDO71683.1 AAA ATPase domain-containing protein [Actinokineospora alba]